jgi:hypothetical protein
VLAGVCTAVARAQTWRTLEASGVRRDSGDVAVRVDYARGKLQLASATRAVLYDYRLRYDATRAHPLISYDSTSRALVIGSEARTDARTGTDGRNAGEGVLSLGRSTPLDLAMRLDVATADLDFGGMALRRLSVRSSASEVRMQFAVPTSVPMEALDLDVGAAMLTASGLANANTSRLRVGARAGGAELRLDGQWTRDLEMDLDIALGSLIIHVPADVGVQLELRRTFARVDAGGLRQSGDLYVSDNWDTATRKVRIRASATLGKFQLVHATR